MLLLNFTFRHLRRHWRLNVAVLFGLTLAAALLASLPSYATAIAARRLDQNLQDASPAVRNLYVTAAPHLLNASLYGRIQEHLGKLVKSRSVVRRATLPADPAPPTDQIDGAGRILRFLELWSFDKLPSSVRLVEGRLPDPVRLEAASNSIKAPPVEAVIGVDAAARSGYGIGDRLTSANEFYRLDIVGIVEPHAPQDDIWGADLSAFEITIDTSDPNVDSITLSLIIAPGSMGEVIPNSETFWRVSVNHDQITVDNAETVQSDLIKLQAQLSTNRAEISTGLITILADYLAQLSRVRMALFLLALQAFIFVLYTLAMLTSFLLDRSQGELASLSGRGATGLQITLVFALESLIMALPAALLLGPGLAQGAISLWAAVTDAHVPSALPNESWLLAGLAAGFGWLALVLPVYPAARRNLLEWQRVRARPDRLSVVQKLYLDLFLLTLGGLLYWQLHQSGSFVMRRLGDTSLADPLLLIGPSLLLIAVAMLFLRVFPFLLRLVAWVFQRTRGLMLPLGLSRLARDPLKSSRVVLLISLTAGLTLFSNAFGNSLSHSQREMAHYLAGADLRISLSKPTRIPPSQVIDLPGVLVASRVFLATVHNEEGRGVRLFAIDPATFDQVARYPPGLTNLTIPSIVRILGSETTADPDANTDDAMPAIFSYAAMPTSKTTGDPVPLTLAGRRLPFKARGTINNFPTLSGPFAVVSLTELEKRLDVNTLGGHTFESDEAWLVVDASQHAALISHPQLEGRILDDAQAQLSALQSDALAEGTGSAFRLSALTLAVLSVAGFLLVHYFAAQQRVIEFSVLRAMGLSARQLFSLVATEGVLVMAMGLLAGTAIGYGLARVMVPYLSQALSKSLAGVSIAQILVDWPNVAQLYALLIGFYALAMLTLLLALVRVGVHRALRIGDE